MPPGTSEFTSSALDSRAAAQWLRERKEEIIEAYASAARAELEAARTVDRDGLVDSLPEVKGIAEAHGGTVSVSSSEEHGTVFTVMLSPGQDGDSRCLTPNP